MSAHLLAVERSTRSEAETTATRLRGLQAVTVSLIRAVDARSVAEAVLTEGVPALGGVDGSILLLAADGKTVEIVHELGYRLAFSVLDLETTLAQVADLAVPPGGRRLRHPAGRRAGPCAARGPVPRGPVQDPGTVGAGGGRPRQTFPSAPASARDARRFVQSVLAEAGLDDLAYTATVLVSELVANAILHTGTPLEVVVTTHAGRARIEVHDGSPQLPVRKHYSDLSGTGRGFLLVEQMAAGWGCHRTAGGKLVWFEIDGQSAPAFDVLGVDAR